MAPTARHRLRFRELDKDWIVESSNRLAIAGLGFLGVSIVGVILLISNVVYGTTEAALATAGILGFGLGAALAAPYYGGYYGRRCYVVQGGIRYVVDCASLY